MQSGFCCAAAAHGARLEFKPAALRIAFVGVALSPEVTQAPFGVLYETLVDGETAETLSLLEDACYEIDFVVKGTARVQTAQGTPFEMRPGDALLNPPTSHLV